MYGSVGFSIDTVLCSHHCCLIIPSIFATPRRNLIPIPLPSVTGSRQWRSVSKDSLTLDISCQWSHTIDGLLCLPGVGTGLFSQAVTRGKSLMKLEADLGISAKGHAHIWGP